MEVLPLDNALAPGADLWIVPEFSSSRWTPKLDWYLNFQILRNDRHALPEVQNFTLFIQNQTGLESFQKPLSRVAPLMIHSQEFFPNKWVVVVPVADEFSRWVKAGSDVWENLKHPTVRFFLPTGQSSRSFLEEWKNHHTFEDFSIVVD